MFRLKLIKSFTQTVKYCRYNHNGTIPQDKIRNIGILAHIDAGKTTTTERMLFYSGKTRSLGEVHHGNTITDCLIQERERGITICSSAVSFSWKDYKINLLDTPGHIDFTMEVEQSLSAVDGSVIILDSSAGVEAQTITVWNQADRHSLPRIVFVNKMDRPDSDFEGCLLDLKNKLNASPIPIYWPVFGGEKRTLTSIIDLINMKQLTWDMTNTGSSYRVDEVSEEYLDLVLRKRNELVDELSGVDDKLAEIIIANDSLENLSSEIILQALRRATLTQKLIPVLLGSAYKNTGVQLLMDAVINFLPSPNQRNQLYDCFGSDFVGKIFKVTHDKQRGSLSLVRVLRGTLRKGNRITTTNGASETITRIYEPLADEYREITTIETGNVGVCAGLKNTVTGDLIVSTMSALKNAQKKLKNCLIDREVLSEEDDLEFLSNSLSLEPKIPDAVYFCSIEPPSLSQQLGLENALKQIQREDPSLRVKYDETTMQTVLGGMGELHLDIIKSRILAEYKIDAELGPLQIAYKESLDETHRDSIKLEKEIAGVKQSVFMEMTLRKSSKEKFKLDTGPEATYNLSMVRPRYINVVKKGALSALERGPKVGGEVVETQVILHNLQIGRGTADSFVMATASQLIQKMLLDAGCHLLEPIMSLEITTPSDRVAKILADLNRRRVTILDIAARGNDNKIIKVLAPLAELAGYSSAIRTISSGGASMSMQPHGTAPMSAQDEAGAIRRAQGFE